MALIIPDLTTNTARTTDTLDDASITHHPPDTEAN